MKKMLIAYYSWSNGNTKAIAEAPQAAAGMLKRAKPPEALNPAM